MRCKEKRALTRDERARSHTQPHVAEVDPADNVLERLTGDAPRDGALELVGVVLLGEQDPRLVLGEHAARLA